MAKQISARFKVADIVLDEEGALVQLEAAAIRVEDPTLANALEKGKRYALVLQPEDDGAGLVLLSDKLAEVTGKLDQVQSFIRESQARVADAGTIVREPQRIEAGDVGSVEDVLVGGAEEKPTLENVDLAVAVEKPSE